MDIIFFNGPPSSGKDEAAKFLRHYWPAMDLSGNPILRRMSHPHKEMFAAMVGAPIDSDGIVLWWEANKERPDDLLNGKSYRQWQIEFSEKFMKPYYGEDIFGKLFALRAMSAHPSTVYLVPDCGFEIEADTVARLLPEARVFLIRIHRPGFDFSNDSRSYIKGNSIPPEHQADIHNNHELDHFHEELINVIASWAGFKGNS